MTILLPMKRFLRETRAGATAIAAAAAAVMTVGGAALISDHVWLVDQRDTLKTASDAAGVAATLEMTRLLGRDASIGDSDLEAALNAVAQRYVEMNLSYLPADRLARALETLAVEVTPDRRRRTVDVSVEADLGGTLLAKNMALFGTAGESKPMRVEALVESVVNPIEVVLAIDISQSMERCHRWSFRRCRNPDDMRISIVKRAAANLVNILDPSADNQVAISVVPWHMVVRLDAAASDAWARDGWAEYPKSRRYGSIYSCGHAADTCPAPAADQSLPSAPPEPWQGCLDEHRVPGGGSHASPAAPAELMDPPSRRAFAQSFFPAPFGTAYECLDEPLPAELDLQFCYDRDNPPGSGVGRRQRLQPAQYGCGDTHPAILPLTSDRPAIDAAVDDLDAVGHLTYSALGVLWGRRLLEHRWKSVWGDPVHPVDPEANEETRKALVLLTDGVDSYCDLGTQRKPWCADSTIGVNRVEACTAAKEAGIEIFVVAAMHPDNVSTDLADTLRACSSESEESEGSYVFLNNATPENLETAFADIANQLSVIRRVY